MFGKNKQDEKHDIELFTMYDSKMQRYWDRPPSSAINEIDLIRTLEEMYHQENERIKNPLFRNAEDFQIFRIGTYHKNSGKLTAFEPQHVANLHELKAQFERSLKPRAL